MTLLCWIFGHNWFKGEELMRAVRGEQCPRCGATRNIEILHKGNWKSWPQKDEVEQQVKTIKTQIKQIREFRK